MGQYNPYIEGVRDTSAKEACCMWQ